MIIKPTNITLNKDKNLLTITFDGKEYALSSEFLRVYSPSAEVSGHGVGQEVLQIGKENVKITDIKPVGNYAVILIFSDEHDSGIFSWEYLLKVATDYDNLWADYLKRLKDAGHSRK
ncbi:FIG028220: hypothetical protein co-occurring with HEAT repeat protein [hydrothermal vent metagenome]|uniref:Gamma-butyrobetaine hydroxylase-like N-terminal domain-containing protein n=1 Tax=hydrothermal vent metagenome TaxID=652676 RepID=A0A1W1BFK7_9ZZZZ